MENSAAAMRVSSPPSVFFLFRKFSLFLIFLFFAYHADTENKMLSPLRQMQDASPTFVIHIFFFIYNHIYTYIHHILKKRGGGSAAAAV